MNITRIVGSLIGLPMAFVVMLFPLGSQADAEIFAPEFVKIKSVSFAGSGCPPDTSSLVFDPDTPDIFSLIFSDYIAAVGKGIPITEMRKNCIIIVRLQFPQGWSFTLFDATYNGFYSLDKKVYATQRSDYFFEGEEHDKSVFYSTFGSSNKAVEDVYEFTDSLPLKDFVWSPCGKERGLVLKTQVYVNNQKNKKGEGIITTDLITGLVEHKYGIQWKKCYPHQ